MERQSFVYIDINKKAHLVGRLWTHVRKGKEAATFEYEKAWLNNPEAFSLEPTLRLGPGPYQAAGDKALFGALGDSAPDRWGRILLRRAEALRARRAKETQRTLFEIDYLLLVNDETRQGALRFSEKEGSSFLTEYSRASVPPLMRLKDLLNAADHITSEKETQEELALLLAPGSSLGGARPKASVRDKDDSLLIAKFPSRNDEYDIIRWEAAALVLAKAAGIETPLWRLQRIGSKIILLSKRFDRDGLRRIPFMSAMSMLGAKDSEDRSYLEFVDALRQCGGALADDSKELFRRIAFNILISNTDDHLRNHGFLWPNSRGWRLSPAYDLNPVPIAVKPRILSTSISRSDNSASIALLFESAAQFGISLTEARKITRMVGKAASTWRKVAKQIGLSSREIEKMSSAFEHQELAAALK